MRVNKVKTRKGKRVLEDRAPKTVENDKTVLFMKGSKTSRSVVDAMLDIYLLKKPLARQLKRHNSFHLFDDETPIEKFCEKYDSSLFLFGSSTKKHPNSLVFGRTYDGQILDMADLSIVKYVPAHEFQTPKVPIGTKPCLCLEGLEFASDPTMKRIGNILVDFFKGPAVDMIRLEGLESFISFTAKENMIYMRVYRVLLLKSGTNVPRVEVLEMGPSIDFKVDRTKIASDSLYKAACKKPRALLAKRRKNMSEDVFGNQLVRVHVGKQNTDAIQTRKVKALKKPKDDASASHSDGREGSDEGSDDDSGDEEMEN
ncbi:unnamed protein product [Nippostrongylus brasiliensis]|uniref:Ribosome production factor 2 homolog n=1 Tax=Nippostrongylus brasiliensis TaxID=27835 RepID=A0A158R2R2_NIPBR|nr:hypothetical protein Q1695_007926 [Nippostrongylus brasiliensis]VDL80201.1 unnamed protein product [Nippostrongylus brasiliensis]